MGVATAISIGTAVAGAAASFTQAAQANKKSKSSTKGCR